MKFVKRTLFSLMIGGLLSIPCQSVLSQDCLWKAFYESGCKALEGSQSKEAEKQLDAALHEAESEPTPEHLVLTLRKLAVVYEGQGRHEQAEKLLRRLLETQEKQSDTNKTSLAGDLNELALECKRQGKFTEAEGLYNRAIKLLSEKVGEGNPLVADTLTSLSVLQVERGKLNDAESSLKKALSIREKELGGNDPKLALTLEMLAKVYAVAGRSQAALPMVNRALQIRQKAQGEEHVDVARTLAQIGRILTDSDRLREAASSVKHALTMRERLLDKDNPEIAESLTDLANLYQLYGGYPNATPLLERASLIMERGVGPKSPQFAEAQRNLAQNFNELHDYDRAEPLLKKALSIDSTPCADPSDHARDLSLLAVLYVSQGKYKEADPLYKQALEIVQTSKGADHPDVAACLNNQAWYYSNQSKFDEAHALSQKGLQIREKALGPKHPAVARNLVNLAHICESQGKLDDAESLFKRALEIQEDALGPDHLETADTVKSLADLYWKMKRFCESEALARRLLALDETVEGKDSAVVADDLDKLSKTLVAQKKSDESIGFRKRAAEIKDKLPGAVQGGDSHGLRIMALQQTQNIARPVHDKWALVVGISNFRDPSINLKYAAKDAIDFRNYLVNEANFKSDHVRLLTDKAATRENIISALGDGWLDKVAQKDDMVVIYVSSHGSGAKRQVGNANFIVAYETNPNNVVLSGIPMQWLTAGVKDVVLSDRVVLLLDVCHGGAVQPLKIEDLPDAPSEKAGDSKGLFLDAFKVRNMPVGNGQIVMTSSDADQLSWESKSYANGVFTRQLIEALRSKKDKTSISDAFKIMKDNVEQEVLRDRSHIQTPLMIRQAWSGPDMVLAVVPTANACSKSPQKPIKKGSLPQPVKIGVLSRKVR